MYNIFKRPMFKRGGSTTGTGIMSHVEPRVRQQFGTGAEGLISEGMRQELTRQAAKRAALQASIQSGAIPTIGTGITATAAALPTFLPIAAMAYSLYGPEATKADEAIGMYGEAAPENVLNEAAEYLGSKGRKTQVIDQKRALNEELNRRKIQAGEYTKEELPPPPPPPTPDKEAPKFEETFDLKTEIKNEAKMIKDLFKDENFSRGELALIVAETLKEPGGLNAKLDKARELAKPIFRKRREEDKSITLTAYKLAKEKEKEEIKAGKLGETEKFVEKRVQLGLKNAAKTKSPTGETLYDGLTENQYREKVYSERLGEDKYSENLAKTRLANEGVRLGRAIEKINELQAKQKTGTLTKEEVTELATKTKFVRSLSNLPGFKIVFGPSLDDPAYIGGYASGGRVNFVEGGMTEVDSVNPIETSELATNNNETAIKPVQKLSFQELRSRLPKEITDDIVTLLANSEQALQDFAYLQTQQDVGNFNVKYGVNLVLPPQT